MFFITTQINYSKFNSIIDNAIADIINEKNILLFMSFSTNREVKRLTTTDLVYPLAYTPRPLA